jgi:hypothetical protein
MDRYACRRRPGTLTMHVRDPLHNMMQNYDSMLKISHPFIEGDNKEEGNAVKIVFV